MGDHRLSVEMSLVGADGKVYKRELWLNWDLDRPKNVMELLMDLAEEAQMPVRWPDELKEPTND